MYEHPPFVGLSSWDLVNESEKVKYFGLKDMWVPFCCVLCGQLEDISGILILLLCYIIIDNFGMIPTP